MGYAVQSIKAGTWVPTFTGFSADPVVDRADYFLIGKVCVCIVYMQNGTSNATGFTMTLPFNARVKSRQAVSIINNSAGIIGLMDIATTPNTNIASFLLATGGVLTASNLKASSFVATYEIT